MRKLLLMISLLLPLSAGAQAMLPTAEHLQQEAVQAQAAGKPLVLMFSLPECPYCRVVRRNYLWPMLRDLPPAEQPVIRELTMNGRQAIKDFDGTVTTPTALAKRYGVKVAPTLVFVNASGELLTEPLVGGDHQFYTVYLDRAFDESQRKLTGTRVKVR